MCKYSCNRIPDKFESCDTGGKERTSHTFYFGLIYALVNTVRSIQQTQLVASVV